MKRKTWQHITKAALQRASGEQPIGEDWSNSQSLLPRYRCARDRKDQRLDQKGHSSNQVC
jgi:hypothetical protein